MTSTQFQRSLASLLASTFFLLSPSVLRALSDNCGDGSWCDCRPAETQCLAPYRTCEEACAQQHFISDSGSNAPSDEAARQQHRAWQAAVNRQQAIVNTNAAGVDYYNRGDWANAINFFKYALSMDPDNKTYKDNLANATQALKNQKDAAAAQAENARQNANAMQRMGNVMGTLNFDGNPAGATPKGLDFTTAVAPAGAGTPGFPPHGDPRIVDARNLRPAVSADIDRAIKGAYPKATPEVVERLKKGFTAVENHDWKVAKAWFQDALKRDPTNAGLQHFVILAEDPADLKKVKAPAAPAEPLVQPINPPKPPKPPEDDVIRFFNDFRDGKEQHPSRAVREYVMSLSNDDFKFLLARQLPDNRDLQYLFDTNPGAAVQIPTNADLEFLFTEKN